ncbi:hypothetical protein GCM10009799_02100 [Nocardiopsis rhodophaea]|uniref:N-acetyltransferase domain-containing protein n=1 Tax=Nocardiopsis rhodophaea TaxID=280238 RepID=A0ABN2S576_9ACTN
MSVTIRPYQEGDAQGIAELYNRHRDNPNPVADGITGDELDSELAERDTAAFLVAVDEGRVVGTFGLFRSTGRRSASAGELIADMFFVAPAYRNGVITGRLFTEAVEWMMRSGCLVLRLTVNPANTVAFRLYRRVGCVCVGATTPGEDGNVELHNYIPLILRSVFADLDEGGRAALGGLSSFGAVTESRDDELRSDVRMADGVRTVAYCLALGDYRLAASVDVDRGVVRAAEITGPGGASRSLRIVEPPYEVRRPRRAEPYRFSAGDLACEVEGDEGTVRVFGAGHHGPLFVSTWPGHRAGPSAGWREGEPRDLEVVAVDGGVRITERHGGDEVVGTVTLSEGVLIQDFAFTRRPGRIFQTVGLRQGTFAVSGPGGDLRRPHPIGLGVGVRDSSEVVAASRVAPAGTDLTWSGSTAEIRVPVEQPVRLVHSTLLERRLEPGPDGVARLRTEFRSRNTPADRPERTAEPPPSTEAARRPPGIRMDAAAAGVTSWSDGTNKVLRSPFPRTRSFACNPRWSAGMWVTAERGRLSRASGLGWGVRPNAEWVDKHDLGLFAPSLGISWEITAPHDGAGGIRVDVQAPGANEDVVLWVTPNTQPRTAVLVDSAGTHWELDTAEFRQVWASAAAVRLSDGSWLDCRPAGAGADAAEVVLRATASGLLIGCVCAARRPRGAEAAWHLAVHSEPRL